MQELTGKVAIVTGASKGIGAAIAREFGAAGASVVVNYASSKEGADRVVEEITRREGRAIAVQGDVSSAADVKRLFERAIGAFGQVDILVNNAAVYQFNAIESVTEEEFHRQFNINVLGLLLATQEAVARFGQEGGSIINIGSAVTTVTPPNTAIYTGTKGAVDAITQVLARELGPRNIRVNAINPGGVDTEGAQSIGMIGSEFERQLVAQTPLGRLGQTRDIAPVALFLASPASGWLTGELIRVAGGLR